MTSIYNSRKFNLIPPRTKEEEVVIKERDNSFFYSFILIFCAIVVYSFLTLAQTLVIEPRISANNENLNNLNTEIATYDDFKKIHGELYIKSQSLDTILTQDIKLTQLLEISEKLKENILNSSVIAYSRETSGQFVIDMRLDNFDDVNLIFTNSEKIDVLEGLNLRDVTKVDIEGTAYIIAKVGFNITNIINENAPQ